MVEPHTPTLNAFSVDDKVAETRELVGEMNQPLHRLNEDVFDELQCGHDRTAQTASLSGPVGTNPEVADLRQRLIDQDQKHKDVVTEIHGILDELELLQSQYVANIRKEVEREIAEQMDRLVQERVAECLKAHIVQELQNEAARSNRDSPEHQFLPDSQLLHTGLPMSPRNPPSTLQGFSTPTLSHTITSPLHPSHHSALAHSSGSLSFTSPGPPPTSGSSTPSISAANRVAAEVLLKYLTKSTPTASTPAVSSPQSLELRQGSPVHMETEDQHKIRLAEQEQNDRLKAEAADKEEKGKEKAEGERKAKLAGEIVNNVKLEKAARLKRQKKRRERLRKEAKTQCLKEEKRRLKMKQEERRKLKAKKDVKLEKEARLKRQKKEQLRKERLRKEAKTQRLKEEKRRLKLKQEKRRKLKENEQKKKKKSGRSKS